MAGIIHFPASSRRSRAINRRSLMLGAAGYVAANTFVPAVSAQGTVTPVGTPGATPMASTTNEPASGRLRNLLKLVPPGDLGGPDPNNWLFTWLDLQTHLTALGNPDPFADTTNIAAITSPLMSNDVLFRFALAPEAKEVFGFSVLDVHQTLVTGSAPELTSYYSGGIDVTSLPAVWEAAGFEKKTSESGEFWTAGERGEVSLDSPVGRFGMGLLNNVAILQGEILVFTSTSEKLQSIQALATNGGASAADDDDLAAVIDAMPADAVNVIALPGAGLEAQSITPENPGGQLDKTTRDLLAESDDAVGPMPEIGLALFGITAGAMAPDRPKIDATPTAQGNPDARMFVELLTASDEDAVAAAQVVTWRMDNMISPVAGYRYGERLMLEPSDEDTMQEGVAHLSFSSPITVAIWYQLLTMQDLWPFVWIAAE